MDSRDFTRQYILLRSIGCSASGFARLEVHHGQGRMVIHAHHLPEGKTVRALLVSAHADPGCVLELGLLQPDGARGGALQISSLPAPALRGYDALLLTTDWPDAAPLLYGLLSRTPRCLLRDLLTVLQRHMALPCADAAPAPPAPIPPAPVQAPPPSPIIAQLQKNRSQLPEDSLLRLASLRWPERYQDLRHYFDTLPPCAPFDAPGWRFIRLPLPQGSPVASGIIGWHCRSHQVDRLAFALPGEYGAQPPEDGYTWHWGRDGQGYWLMLQECSATQ